MLRKFELELMWFWVRLTVATSIALILASVFIVLDAHRQQALPPHSFIVEIDDGITFEDLPTVPVWFTSIPDEQLAYRVCRDHLYGVIPATESEPEYYVCVLAGS